MVSGIHRGYRGDGASVGFFFLALRYEIERFSLEGQREKKRTEGNLQCFSGTCLLWPMCLLDLGAEIQ